MRRAGLPILLLSLLSLGIGAALPAGAQAEEEQVRALDDAFSPGSLTIDPGTRVTFVNEGTNPHTVTADDGGFDSGNLDPGESFSVTADDLGSLTFHCRYHGAAGGLGMSGTLFVGVEPSAEPGEPQTPQPGRGATIRVPQDHPTIQAAVGAALPGDLVLVSPGVYREGVEVTTPNLTIRGTDRNEVILDGDFRYPNGIHVLGADGVTIENMTARHYGLNGFYWIGVDGYRGSYLTAYQNGDYGVYAFDSVHGQFDNSYAAGHPDSGFYIGQCRPCHAVVRDVVSEWNGIGWSGTNASGDLVLANSEWRFNQGGIVPNTLDSELLAPQRGQTIVGNWVHDNNNQRAPAKIGTYPAAGIGILLAGGSDNVVERNLVEGHDRYGIAVIPMIDRNLWLPGGNRIEDNHVRGSGLADLALAAPAPARNCFAGNTFGTSAPAAVELVNGCGFSPTGGGGGDLSVTTSMLGVFAESMGEDYPQGSLLEVPEPPPQPNMPNAADAPPAPAVGMPEPFDVGSATIPAGDGTPRDGGREVTVLGVSLAQTPWWKLLISWYGYVLPLVLYATWVAVAVWDLVRREDVSGGARAGWMAAILLVPIVGPIAYYVAGRSRIPASVRLMLIVGGMLAYVLFAGLAFVLGST
jgi:plastocyanin